MVIFVHSLGSLWQEKTLPAGGSKIWNTTGIRDGSRVRSCAKIFGQVALGAKARLELARSGSLTGELWTAGELKEAANARKLKLLCRASRQSEPDLYLVVVTERLVGELRPDSWDAAKAMLVSFSQWRSRQEALLLVRPFAWLRGAKGSAVFSADDAGCDWKIASW